MSDKKYKYDVAFSFLDEDEEFATQINDLLKDRLSTFIYSERQKELAGNDGEKTFIQVFGSEARTVFVLYRVKWGKTPWTRIEETAIRNRAYNESYDFVIFGRFDKSSRLPEYLPKTQIWVDLERWGAEVAAGVIETKVQEYGGTPQEETLEERAARLSREVAVDKERRTFLDSIEGVRAALQEIKDLFSECEKFVNAVSNKEAAINFQYQHVGNTIVIKGGGYSLGFLWSQQYRNSLKHSALYQKLWKGNYDASGRNIYVIEKPSELKELTYNFYISNTGEHGWREAKAKKRFYSSKRLIEISIEMLFNKIRSDKI